jgi:hypothetical protein
MENWLLRQFIYSLSTIHVYWVSPCGKSTITEFFSHNALVPFGVISSRQIVRQFLREGYPVLDRYGERAFQPIYAGAAVEFDRIRPLTWCFDEFGMGMGLPSPLCGQPVQVLAEILLDWYELFLQQGMLTHVITHLSEEEVELRYGKRVTNRLKEMCNQVQFPVSLESHLEPLSSQQS